jgi:Fic family protein
MQPFHPEKLPPKDINLSAMIPLIGKANRAVATFEGLLYGIPNPNVLLSPIVIQEAVLSSKIEGTQADLKDVLKFEAGETPSGESQIQDIQEIRNYRRALGLSEKFLQERPFCLNTLLQLHSVLMDSVRGANKARGHFRTTQNWIGSPGSPIEQAAFVPPSPLDLQHYLDDWEAYWHQDDGDPIVQLALVHAQFEIIHPFLDGNGRIGRMLVPLFLFEKKILTKPCFYLSAFFEAHKDEYIQRLRALGQTGSWTAWIEFILRGVAVQAEENTIKARAIQDLYERLKKKIIQLTHSPYAVPMLDYMFERPIFRSSDFEGMENMPSAPTRINFLRKLKESGLLSIISKGAGRRPDVLALHELLNLCEGRQVL